MDSKNSKTHSSEKKLGRKIVPTLKIQQEVDRDFDDEVDHEANLHSPQVDDYQTMEPLSGEGLEVRMESRENKAGVVADEVTVDDISYMLSRHPEIDASDVLIRINKGDVILSGTVPEERMKFMTAEVVKLIHGVKSVTNQLKHVKVDKTL